MIQLRTQNARNTVYAVLAHLRSELDAQSVDHNYQDCDISQNDVHLFEEMLVKETSNYDDTGKDFHNTKVD